MKLVLGTVQFGLDYGVSNTSGRVPHSEVSAILELAKNSGIDTLDTAAAYGDAEEVLGSVGVGDFKVITKLPPLGSIGNIADVKGLVQSSLDKLKIERLEAVLLHRSEDLNLPGLLEHLQKMKSEGMLRRLGLSVYDPAELPSSEILAIFDIIQAPANALDLRFLESSILQNLRKIGVDLHCRSVFLQGLLLMESESRPEYFKEFYEILNWWDKQSLEFRDRVSASLAALKYQKDVRGIVVGCQSARELNQIIDAYKDSSSKSLQKPPTVPADLYDPRKWLVS